MVQEHILIKAALRVYLIKLKSSEESPFTISTSKQIETMLKQMD
ncbi:hypothetical protein PL373_04155 [Tenacibaculum maritimum]|nr:hypothetical protein [Tenacibaculum maritimum]MDB0600348.1 hypothetical protein [Tenacibaculum maritimum]MDB0611148.1 hypothetical protein [Tenacibaculum maritimum]